MAQLHERTHARTHAMGMGGHVPRRDVGWGSARPCVTRARQWAVAGRASVRMAPICTDHYPPPPSRPRRPRDMLCVRPGGRLAADRVVWFRGRTGPPPHARGARPSAPPIPALAAPGPIPQRAPNPAHSRPPVFERALVNLGEAARANLLAHLHTIRNRAVLGHTVTHGGVTGQKLVYEETGAWLGPLTERLAVTLSAASVVDWRTRGSTGGWFSAADRTPCAHHMWDPMR